MYRSPSSATLNTAIIIKEIIKTLLSLVDLVVQRFGVGLVIERSLVRLPAGALSSKLGQLSLPLTPG